MANRLLTPDDITRESLRILHQKLNFVGNVVRDYDDRYANDGAKIGNSLRIRLPIQYSTGTGSTMATGTGADSQENNVQLTINSQRHVPMRFNSNEMTMKLDEFSTRHVEPAMAKLAAMIEADALSMVDNVPNVVLAGTKVELVDVLSARKQLQDELAPLDNRCCLLDTQANVDMVDSLKGLFNDGGRISQNYKTGQMGNTAGLDFYENTLLGTHTSGTEGGGVVYDANNVTAQEGSYTSPNSMTLTVDTGTKTIAKGDVITIAGVNSVHPETKADTGSLKTFTVIGGDTGTATATSLTITPALIATGPHKNASAAAANNATITVLGAASTAYKQSLVFQKGAFAFGTADLVLPKGVHMASRQVYDGISLRLVQQYDVIKDRVYTRIDCLYGYLPLRPQLASKIWHT